MSSSRPLRRCGSALLFAAAVTAVFSPAAFAKAPPFHRDETPLPKSLSSPAPAAVHAASTSGTLARTVAGLAVVLAVLFGVYWLLRTYGRGKGPKGDGRLEIVATTPLAPNRAVHLIRVGDGLVLVGSAEGSITRLKAYSPAESELLEARIDGEPGPLRPFGDPSEGPGFSSRRAGTFIDELRKRTARR